LEAAGESSWFATGKIFQAGTQNILDATWDLVCRGGCSWRAGQGRSDGPEFARARGIWFAPWTAVLVRTGLFARIGYLDEGFESYLEDVEFGLRCAAQGMSGVYEPRALAWHHGSGTLGRWHADTVRRIARNQVRLVARHFETRFSWPVLAAQALWGGLALRHGRFTAWLHGKWQGLRDARAIARTHREQRLTLVETLEASEREIYTLQGASGFDFYWRMYFFIAGHGTK
jgi:GT2 family glycosyltransferase